MVKLVIDEDVLEPEVMEPFTYSVEISYTIGDMDDDDERVFNGLSYEKALKFAQFLSEERAGYHGRMEYEKWLVSHPLFQELFVENYEEEGHKEVDDVMKLAYEVDELLWPIDWDYDGVFNVESWRVLYYDSESKPHGVKVVVG